MALDPTGRCSDGLLEHDTLSRLSGSFDFIHSYIVFQHIPPSRGEAIAARLLERLEAGGIAALHFTYRTPSAFLQRFTRWARLSVPFAVAAANLLRGRAASNPYMQVYEYDLGRLFDLFRAAGCDRLHLELTNHGGVLGAMFYRRKPAGARDR